MTQPDKAPVLLIDEVDRADEEFEAFLLEVLSDFQVTIPEIGTLKASQRPLVILTSNRSRDLSDALRRRCLYLWLDYPDLAKELRIVRKKVEGIEEGLARQICRFVERARETDLEKTPGHLRDPRLGEGDGSPPRRAPGPRLDFAYPGDDHKGRGRSGNAFGERP